MVAAKDAPSIYDIPKVLHAEGLDAYVVRRLGLPFRDVEWSQWDDLLRRVHHPKHQVTVALVGKYVDLPDAYLSVSEALRAGGFANDCKVEHPLGDLRRLRDARRAPRCELGGVDAVCIPGGFGVRGIEGKLGAIRLRPRAPHPDARAVPGPAVHGDRVRPARGRPRGRRLAGVRRAHAAPGDRHDGRPGGRRGGRRRHGRHHAARALPGDAGRGLDRRARCTAGARRASGTGTATRSTTPTASSSRRPAWCSPAPRRTAHAGRVRRAAARRAPVLRGHPGAPRVPVPADPAAPAVRRPGRRRRSPASRHRLARTAPST